jgi:hypothetical protein
MYERTITKEVKTSHHIGAMANGNDLVMQHIVVTDTAHPTYLQITSLDSVGQEVAPEFMRDAAIDALAFVAKQLERRATA